MRVLEREGRKAIRRTRGASPARAASGLAWLSSGALTVAIGCGGAASEPAIPPPTPPPAEEASDPTWNPDPVAEPATEAPPPAAASSESALAEPEFTPGMSVNEAIAAVPSHYDFVGIEPEVLAKPLQDPALFETCQLSSSTHFNVRLAVWDGRVVGADVKAPSPALERCIDAAVRQLKYEERAQSVNTVEFSY